MSRYQHYDLVDDEIMDGDQYEVGYKKPPKNTRFKPGQSGNPNGRPKTQKSNQDIFEEILMGQVTLVENGSSLLSR